MSVTPSPCWTKQAVAGKGMSPVTVAQMIRSRSPASTFASARAAFAAASAIIEVVSPSPMTRRSLMPVRWTIHSSEVSMTFSKSALVITFDGT